MPEAICALLGTVVGSAITAAVNLKLSREQHKQQKELIWGKIRYEDLRRIAGLIVEELYYANDIYVHPSSRSGWAVRQSHQRKALSTLKLLSYVSELAMELQAIQPKQYEQISKQTYNVQNLLGAWINSDSKRFMSGQKKSESSS